MDLHCRVCGEPWDSTGGLDYSHSELTWWEYKYLLHGQGCPCCKGEFRTEDQTVRDKNHEQWLKSVIRLSEGEIDVAGDLYLLQNLPLWMYRKGQHDLINEEHVIAMYLDEDLSAGERFVAPLSKEVWYCVGKTRPGLNAFELPWFRKWFPTGQFLSPSDKLTDPYSNASHTKPGSFVGVIVPLEYRTEYQEPTWKEILSIEDPNLYSDLEDLSVVWNPQDDEFDHDLYIPIPPQYTVGDSAIAKANLRYIEKHFGDYYIYPSLGELAVSIGSYQEGEVDVIADRVKELTDVLRCLEDTGILDDELVAKYEREEREEAFVDVLTHGNISEVAAQTFVSEAMVEPLLRARFEDESARPESLKDFEYDRLKMHILETHGDELPGHIICECDSNKNARFVISRTQQRGIQYDQPVWGHLFIHDVDANTVTVKTGEIDANEILPKSQTCDFGGPLDLTEDCLSDLSPLVAYSICAYLHDPEYDEFWPAELTVCES